MFARSGLYAIVDRDACRAAALPPLSVAAAFVAGGARVVQVRAKDAGGRDLLALVEAVQRIVVPAGGLVITNDRVDVARTAGTGVHLGQEDLPAAAARAILGPDAAIGVSTHTPAQLDAALRLPVSYVAFGPVYATATKANPDAVVGLDGVRAAARAAGDAGLPLVAIGGITMARAREVAAAGADAVAVISDLLGGTEGPESRVRQFLVALGGKPV